MTHRHIILLALLASIACSSATARPIQIVQDAQSAHVPWVLDAMARIETIKPGMTRNDLQTSRPSSTSLRQSAA
jgi:hypothetical protein